MRMNKEDRKYIKVKTTEILDFLAKEVDYMNTKDCDKRSDYRDELEQREPFVELKNKIDQLERRLSSANRTIALLVEHKHNKEDGNVSVGIEKATPRDLY